MHKIFLLILGVSLIICSSYVKADDFKSSQIISKKTYKENSSDSGVVLLDVNWGRKWSCGDFENAQLVSINFVKFNTESLSYGNVPELSVNTPSRVFVNNEFSNFAFQLPEGEYALHSFRIKVARSVKEVGYVGYGSNDLIKEQKALGGTFTVQKGEVVFIGNFFLDCAYGPTLWRYHSDGIDSFKEQVNEYKKSFPFINFESVVFRLFKTSEFGVDYELPKLSK
jgi:hypothetical protein